METVTKDKAIRSLIWSAIDRFSDTGIRFLLGIILARLLLPTDFGLIGMLSIFLAISQSLVDSGFSTALIQKKDTDQNDYSTVFFFNIFVGLVIYLILYISAPFIADFYEEELLIDLTRVVGLNVIINSFALVQRARLSKALNFKDQTKISFVSTIVSGIIGIYLAYSGYGVWALVFQTLSRNVLIALLYWVIVKWNPAIVFDKKSFKELFGFGSKLLFSGLLNTAFDNLYLIVIGKYYSARSLGFYTKAYQLNQLPVGTLTGIIQRVILPVFSPFQDDEVKLRSGYKKAIKFTAYIIFPLMTILFVVAKPLVILVLTQKWEPIVPIFQLFAVAGLLYPIHALNLNLLNVKGRSDLFLRLEIYKKILIVIAILTTVKFGIMMMIIGQIVVSLVAFIINTYYTGKYLAYGTVNQIIDLLPYLLVSFFAGSLAYLTSLISNNLWFDTTIPVFTFIISYLLLGLVFRFSEPIFIFNYLRQQK